MKTKITYKQIFKNLNKIRISNSPFQIEGFKGLQYFLSINGISVNKNTLKNHIRMLSKIKRYSNTYNIHSKQGGLKVTYCSAFIIDILRLSIALKIGRVEWDKMFTERRFIGFVCQVYNQKYFKEE